MSLIPPQIKPSAPSLAADLPDDTASLASAYAEFIRSTVLYVIAASIHYVCRYDKEFHAWLDTHHPKLRSRAIAPLDADSLRAQLTAKQGPPTDGRPGESRSRHGKRRPDDRSAPAVGTASRRVRLASPAADSAPASTSSDTPPAVGRAANGPEPLNTQHLPPDSEHPAPSAAPSTQHPHAAPSTAPSTQPAAPGTRV